jgi:hypothetical protein
MFLTSSAAFLSTLAFTAECLAAPAVTATATLQRPVASAAKHQRRRDIKHEERRSGLPREKT